MKTTKQKILLHAKFMAATLIALMLYTASEAKTISRKSNTFDSTWKLDATVNDVECYYKIENCNGTNIVFLAFNNKNSGDVKITWVDVLNTQFDTGLPSIAGQKELILAPGESSVYDCNSPANIAIVNPLEVHPAYIAAFSGYSFKVISVVNN